MCLYSQSNVAELIRFETAAFIKADILTSGVSTFPFAVPLQQPSKYILRSPNIPNTKVLKLIYLIVTLVPDIPSALNRSYLYERLERISLRSEINA